MAADLIVEAHPSDVHGVLRCGELLLPCVLGRSGLTADKHEGDGGTPVGRFPLRRLLYRADRIATPVTGLATDMITRDGGWCDAPEEAAYNQQVKLPFAPSHEDLWREDGLYDLIVVIGYNDAPVQPSRGSAIFLHVRSPDGAPTAGCVALALDDLLKVLAMVDSDSHITITTL